MSWDLDTAKAYLGITDGSKDTQIQLVLDTTMAMVESYLQRQLLNAVDLEQKLNFWFGDVILLDRYPVTQLTSVDDGDVPGDWVLESKSGRIILPCDRYYQDMTIVYDGGYVTLPLDLERVLWEIFRMIWGQTDEDTGGPEEGTGGTQGGELRSFTAFDAFKLDFANSAMVASADSVITKQQAEWGPLAPWASTLELYRSERGAGIVA